MDEQAIRRVAILIATADHQTADALLERLEPEQAAAVRKYAVGLQEVDETERDDILSEFTQNRFTTSSHAADAYAAMNDSPRNAPADHFVPSLMPSQRPAGIDLSGDAVIQLRIPGSTLDSVEEQTGLESDKRTRPLNSLKATGASELAKFLEKEGPQTIAVVFSHLDPAQASAVLEQLPLSQRGEVLERLTKLEETDEEIIHEVELGLQEWLTQQTKRERRRRAGVSAVARILDAANNDLRHQLLADLADRDSELTEQIEVLGVSTVRQDYQPDLVSFVPTPEPTIEAEPMPLEDIAKLRTTTLIRILEACDRNTLLLALAGAEPEIVSDILSVLGLADGREIREAIGQLGPMRLSDVDACQDRLGRLAQEMTSDNVTPSRPGWPLARAA